MALKIVFARQAQRDLEDILSYIAIDDQTAARRMMQRIEKIALLLADRPYAGPLVPASGDAELRKMSVPPYIIYYRPKPEALQIARILHSSRDLDLAALFRR